MNNQRGGIIGSIFLIPIGVALMVGFFFLGYYIGKYQSKTGMQDAIVPPLPEVVARNIPKKEEFTFYKTLTDKSNKTVSIELKPKETEEEPVGRTTAESRAQGKSGTGQLQKEKKPEARLEKPRTVTVEQTVKKEPVSNAGQRFTLQIASYPEKETAEQDVKKLKHRGYAAFIVSTEIDGKGTWYRVRLGSFSNKTAAEKLLRELRAREGITPFITPE